MNGRELDRRRALLGGLGALGAAALGSCGRVAAGSVASEPILVLVQLYGGVDGLSTVAPYRADEYYRARPTTALAANAVLRLDAEHGLHPSLAGVNALFHDGRAAIVEGCGYPEPFYSHFRAFDVWHTGFHEGKVSGDGWIGRLRAAAWSDRPDDELVVHVGSEMPWSLGCTGRPPLVFGSAGNFRALSADREQRLLKFAARNPAEGESTAQKPRDRALGELRRSFDLSQRASQRVIGAVENYRPRVEYPDDALAQTFRTIAAMIDSGFETRVYSLLHGNYDSHGGVQNFLYGKLHKILDRSLTAFLDDVRHSSRGRDVVVLAFSEFGRRFHENQSRGTDHGAAGPMILLGERVKGGIYGRAPSLVDIDGDDNLIFTTDFRRVYASVLEQCFGVPNERVLSTRYEPLPLFA